jgi:pre-rRNA-processing protein TSR3
MESFPPTVILRHRRENLKKCSLRGLETREDMRFYSYPTSILPDLTSYVLLGMDAPVLSKQESAKGIFLIDATWRYASQMLKQIPTPYPFIIRTLPPNFETAYPRRQDDCPDPTKGLASIEALYLAYVILGRDPTGLLDLYHWKEEFLEKNAEGLSALNKS